MLTHFFAFHLHALAEPVTQLQSQITTLPHDSAVRPLNTHITLLTLSLQPDDISAATRIAQEAVSELVSAHPALFQGLPVQLNGLDHFHQRVVWAKPEFGTLTRALHELRARLIAGLDEYRLGMSLERAGSRWTPHSTLYNAKYSASKFKLDPTLVHRHHDFAASCVVTGLSLLATKRLKGGLYPTASFVPFVGDDATLDGDPSQVFFEGIQVKPASTP